MVVEAQDMSTIESEEAIRLVNEDDLTRAYRLKKGKQSNEYN
jgi:hypothetical protein